MSRITSSFLFIRFFVNMRDVGEEKKKPARLMQNRRRQTATKERLTFGTRYLHSAVEREKRTGLAR